MPWALLLNRYTFVALAMLAVLGATAAVGNKYGPNARGYAACKSETARRNAAVTRVNASEEKRHAAEATKRAADRAEFDKRKPSIGQCILTGDMAAALNGIGE